MKTQSNHPLSRARRITRGQPITGNLTYRDLFADNLRRCYADKRLGAAVPPPKRCPWPQRPAGALTPPGAPVTRAKGPTPTRAIVPRPTHLAEFDEMRRRKAVRNGRSVA